jgi:hypothetical protein
MNTVNAYLELAKLCMDQTYFQINGRYYKQNLGTSMGNALSPFLANLFMTDYKVKLSTRLWIRHNTIKFTRECLVFLGYLD